MLPNDISPLGQDLIKNFEGLHKVGSDGRVYAYRCPAGKLTIGYGHTKGVTANQVISKEQAEEYLREDLEDTDRILHKYVKVPLTQNQYDALGSFVFNLGEGNFAKSTLLKRLNEKRYDLVPEQLTRWNKANNPRTGKKEAMAGLTRRRAAEAAMFVMDTPIPAEVPDPMIPQEPLPTTIKPITKSRTLWGVSIAGIATIVDTIAMQATPFMHAHWSLDVVVTAAQVIGLALAAYARIDDQRKAFR